VAQVLLLTRQGGLGRLRPCRGTARADAAGMFFHVLSRAQAPGPVSCRAGPGEAVQNVRTFAQSVHDARKSPAILEKKPRHATESVGPEVDRTGRHRVNRAEGGKATILSERDEDESL